MRRGKREKERGRGFRWLNGFSIALGRKANNSIFAGAASRGKNVTANANESGFNFIVYRQSEHSGRGVGKMDRADLLGSLAFARSRVSPEISLVAFSSEEG